MKKWMMFALALVAILPINAIATYNADEISAAAKEAPIVKEGHDVVITQSEFQKVLDKNPKPHKISFLIDLMGVKFTQDGAPVGIVITGVNDEAKKQILNNQVSSTEVTFIAMGNFGEQLNLRLTICPDNASIIPNNVGYMIANDMILKPSDLVGKTKQDLV